MTNPYENESPTLKGIWLQARADREAGKRYGDRPKYRTAASIIAYRRGWESVG